MGQIVDLKCKKCHKEYNAKLGIGLLHFNINNISKSFSKDVEDKIMDIAKNHKLEDYLFNNVLIKCDKCKKIYSKPYIKIKYDKDRVFEYGSECTYCGVKGKILDISKKEDLICFDCKNLFDVQIVGIWD